MPNKRKRGADAPSTGPEVGVLRLPWWSRAPLQPVVGVELVPHLLLLRCPQHRFACRWHRLCPSDDASTVAGSIVAESLAYTPVAADVGSELLISVVALLADGSQVEGTRRSARSAAVCSAEALPPPDRRVAATTPGVTVPSARQLRVLSYNILAPCLASERMFPYTPPWSLNWGYRQQVLHAEIALLAEGADVLCMQVCMHMITI